MHSHNNNVELQSNEGAAIKIIKRPRRAGVAPVNYSEVKRRGPIKRKAEGGHAYMDASSARAGRVTLYKAIEVGEVTIERVVGGMYEWRDGAYVEKRRVVFDDGG